MDSSRIDFSVGLDRLPESGERLFFGVKRFSSKLGGAFQRRIAEAQVISLQVWIAPRGPGRGPICERGRGLRRIGCHFNCHVWINRCRFERSRAGRDLRRGGA